MEYIEIPAAKQKIVTARAEQSNIFITAPTGYGKTVLVEHYFGKEPKWLDCLTGELSEMPDVDSIKQKTVVIDDLSYLVDEKSRSYIKSLIAVNKYQIILIGRSDFPNWLSEILISYEFVRIWTRDLMFGEEQVRKYLAGHNLSNEDISAITANSKGYPIAVKFCRLRIDSGEKYVEGPMFSLVWDDLLHYFEKSIFDRLHSKILDMLLTMCPYEVFDIELAQAVILTNENISEWIIYVRNVGSILQKITDSEYTFEPHVRRYLLWKRDFVYSEEIKKEQYRRAGNYFEKKNILDRALMYYKLAGSYDLMENVLIRHSSVNIGAGQYYKLREYYLSIPEERLYKSPNLMAAVSIIYSMQMMPEKSEELYFKIKEIEKNPKTDPNIKKEAKSRLIWLDISLPHRCGKGMVGTLKNAAMMIVKKEIELPDFSPTSNMPSLMNGGLDMSEWSKIDVQLAKFVGKPLETVLQNQGKGIVNVALAESGFEKGTLGSYEVLTRCHNGYTAAFSYGNYEMCFAALAVVARQHVLNGQLPSAKKSIENFRDSINISPDSMLLKNIEAFCVSLSIYEHADDVAREFLKNAPDEKDFYVLNRYLYMVKLKCLMATDRLTEALSLSCVLEEYFTNYGRTIFWIKNRAYRAIILYRQNDSNWVKELESAIIKASEYHFVRSLSLIGQPLVMLLSEWHPGKEIDTEFVDELRKEAEKVAKQYPEHLSIGQKTDIELTPQEERILAMLCQGWSLQDIAEECNIKYNSVRVHTHNIYQKLGVCSRSEAEHMAMRLKLVPMGENL